ncbi:hypothetical protein NMY22_g7649 [Coprinellus aureogranulatus]|nr:hypothetical protein NMY22_g7649 [Coprinellus aureogranulatus]
MEIDEADMLDGSSSDDDDENDSEEVKALKACRRYLKNLLTSSRQSVAASSRSRPRSGKKTVDNRPALNVVPSYTILVVDTNILLSSLSMITSLVESMKWTVVVPPPVIMELDGLASNITPQLADAASAAINYIDEQREDYGRLDPQGHDLARRAVADRSATLKTDPASAAQTANVVKVVFVILDRNATHLTTSLSVHFKPELTPVLANTHEPSY